METIDLPPKADSLMESMRDVGYSFESAIADLIDNCVSAGARHVDIRFSALDPPYVAVLDDGRGMSASELTQAMRPGSQSPRETRSSTDLGRFGLGLKTASLSQCRRLTVVSRSEDVIAGREWDLDYLNQVGDWKLKALAGPDIDELPAVDQLGPFGTAVIWRELDRLRENFGEASFEAGMAAAMDRAQRHLEWARARKTDPGLHLKVTHQFE